MPPNPPSQSGAEVPEAASRTTIELKCEPPYFDAVLTGDKLFELRRDDRGFTVGDTLLLREVGASGGCTGRSCERRITYTLRGFGAARFGLAPGFVALGLAPDLPAIRAAWGEEIRARLEAEIATRRRRANAVRGTDVELAVRLERAANVLENVALPALEKDRADD